MELARAGLQGAIARRAVEERELEHLQTVQRIVDATYRVIERTGDVDPPIRAVLREGGVTNQAFYKCFRSKDELLLVLLDDGRRRLVDYLERRMARVAGCDDKVRAWVEGVLAQAGRADAASRTRPFLTNQHRLVEQFPDEQQASVDLLVDLLAGVLDDRRDADAVYHLTFGALHAHLSRGTRPAPGEVEHLVGFCLRAINRGRR